MGTYLPTQAELELLKNIFGNIKAEKDLELEVRLKELFVTTHEYFEAQRGGKAIVIGRKGSGKTALIKGFRYNHSDKYQSIGEIDADDLPVTTLYNYYLVDIEKQSEKIAQAADAVTLRSIQTDVADLMTPARLSTYAWEKAFANFSIYQASISLLEDNNLSKEDYKVLKNISSAIKGDLDAHDPAAFLYALLTEKYDEIKELIEAIISNFAGEVWGKLLSLLTNKIIGKFREPPSQEYQKALDIIKYHNENNDFRILITFDRFDDFYDVHYSNLTTSTGGDRNANRTQQSILQALLEGLILAVSSIKNNPEYVWVNLLITIPMDKFMELNLRERARIEIDNTIQLNWTPLELFDYANRRIAMALGDKVPEGQNPWYFIFPRTITNVSINKIPEDSFLYMLRHTLWKPREVQMYIQKLLEVMLSGGFSFEQRERIFREAIHSQAREIFRQQFSEEFQKQYPRLRKLLKQLQTRKIYTVMPFSGLFDLLPTSGLSDDVTDRSEVLRRLYVMGVIGVRKVLPYKQWNYEATVTQAKQEVAYTYFFNSKDYDPFTPDVDICFHPMFFDEVAAEHKHDYIINELSWDMFSNPGRKLLYRPKQSS